MKIGIVDYHLNNLRSVQKAFETIGASSFISDKPEELLAADKLVLPGVGAFGRAMENLRRLHLNETVALHVQSGRPLLGICLGMQLLFEKSSELGEFEGLSFLNGTVRQFPETVKVPHIGWNQIDLRKESPLLADIVNGSFVYFVHSYYVETPADCVLATTEYGPGFPSIVQQKNVYGMQFHPEKSQTAGLKLLQNFAERS
jgi:glutamine amidotransferase